MYPTYYTEVNTGEKKKFLEVNNKHAARNRLVQGMKHRHQSQPDASWRSFRMDKQAD